MKEAGIYGGHEGIRAVTLSHDEGQRFKFMGQDGGLVCFLYLQHGLNTHSNHPPAVFSGILGEYKTFIHSYSFFLYISLHLLLQ